MSKSRERDQLAMATGRTYERQVLDVPGVGAPEDVPTSPAVKVGPFVFVGGISAMDPETGLEANAQPHLSFPLHGANPIKLETRNIYEKLRRCLDAGGSSLESTVQINQWLPCYSGDDIRDPDSRDRGELFFENWRAIVEPALRVRDEYIVSERDRPPSAFVPIDRLLCADQHVEVEILGLTADSEFEKVVFEHEEHVPLGGYSIGMAAGPWVFTAGFSASKFGHGVHPNAEVRDEIWYGNRVQNEVAETLRQLKLAVEEANARLEDTVKAVVYLTPLALRNLPAVEEVWKQYWPKDPPARGIVPCSGIGTKTLNVEISLIVTRPQFGGKREIIYTDGALPPLGHTVQAIKSGPLLFLSSQTGRTEKGLLPRTLANDRAFPFLRRSVKDQIRAIHQNTQAVCEAAGTSIEETVKANLFFSHFDDLAAGLPVWAEPFSKGYPASGFFEVPFVQEVPGCRVTADLTIAC